MTQVTLGLIALPETSRDQYACWEEDLSVQVDMISGRRVIETRGSVWKVRYAYDYMGNELMRTVMAVLRSGAPILVTFLPDEEDEPRTSWFVVESVGQPTFAFSRAGKPYWHNLSFTLREERPHD